MRKNHKNVGRLLCLLLTLCMTLSTLSAAALAVESASGEVVINEANFPDANFRKCVAEYDSDKNGALSDAERAATVKMDVWGKKIENLQGIEYFTALKSLDCRENQLTSLDLSKNVALEELNCGLNCLTSLDLSHNTALKTLGCECNQITALDVSHNAALRDVYCGDNRLLSLDFSKNAALINLDCALNYLTSLNVSNNAALRILYCEFNQLKTLDISNNTGLGGFDCSYNRLTELDLSKNKSLFSMICSGNRLTALDVSNNKELKGLGCAWNQLTSLDLTENLQLEELDCSGNWMGSLDLRKNEELKALWCGKNYLTSLNLNPNSAFDVLQTAYNAYVLPKKENFDYTQLPGGFDIDKVSEVTGGKFNRENHTFSMNPGAKNATYCYDAGTAQRVCFKLCTNPFGDVKDGSFYRDAAIWAANYDVSTGTTATTFSPKQNCKRSQVVTFLWRAAGCPEPKSMESHFRDVQDSSKFYYKAVLWAAENDIASGIEKDLFKPDSICKRSQVVTFLWRAVGRPEPLITSGRSFFQDVQDTQSFYYKAVLWAAENGITLGVQPGVFRPNGICNRGEIVTFLYRCV